MTQSLLYFVSLRPILTASEFPLTITIPIFIQLVICTILLAAGSFIVNDVFDIEIDKINKPDKLIVSNTIPIRKALLYYLVTVVTGLIFAINIANVTNKLSLIWIYPMSIFLLYFYARRWKKSFLIGNIIVALFSSFVAGIILLASWNNIQLLRSSNEQHYEKVILVFGFYIVFAFLTSLIREIIKDIQDMEGDRDHDAQTLPIMLGVDITKKTIYSLNLILITAIFLWTNNQTALALWKHAILLIGVALPLIYLYYLIQKAKNKNDYKSISTFIKIVMVIGIGYLFVI